MPSLEIEKISTLPAAEPLKVSEMLDIAWRTVATGFCFATFGLGQLLLGFTLFPLILILVRNEQKRRRLCKYAIHISFKLFVFLMWVTRTLDYDTENLERLDRKGLLVLANHPSLIDAVFLISFMPQCDCVMKAALLNNPFIQFAARGAGYIPMDEDFMGVVNSARASFEEGNSLLIFPEATRSEPGLPLNLRRGASHVAVRNQRHITPVVIHTSQHNLSKHSSWWKTSRKRPYWKISVNEDLSIAPFAVADKEPATAARELTDFLSEYFNREVAKGPERS